jgi:hypothetical protein
VGLFSKQEGLPKFVLCDGGWLESSVITTGWMVNAAKAWIGYLESGRGCVVIDPNEGGNQGQYVSATRPSLVASRSPAARQLRDDLARYDPMREVVISFFGARDEKALRAGKIEEFSGVLRPPTKDSLTPPQAYAAFAEMYGEAPE